MPRQEINKNARDAIVDQQILNGMMDLVINIDQETYDKLDKLDQDALQTWHNNYQQLSKHKGEKRDFFQQKGDLERIVNLYKVYGTNDNALVNQVRKPYQLTVKNREQAQQK